MRTSRRSTVLTIAAVALVVLAATPAASLARPSERILGGRPNGTVDVRLTSSVVALAARGSGPVRARAFCSGAVIAPSWVLTARHCVQDLETGALTASARTLLIARGAGDGTAYGSSAASNDVVGVARILVAPGSWRNVDARAGDVALVRLAKPLRTAVPIAYAAQTSASWWGDGAGRALGAYAVGWGTFVASGRGPMSAYARFTELPIISTDECMDRSDEPRISAKYICAGSTADQGAPVRIPCSGDSGGPLVATDPATTPETVEPTDALRIVGTVSFSMSANCALTPEHYTPVAPHAAWIAKATGIAPAA